MTAEALVTAGQFYDAEIFRARHLEQVALEIVRKVIKNAGIYSHQITSRHKTRASYLAKAGKRLGDDSLKYTDPSRQITDLIGIRVVVSIGSDVPEMAAALRAAFDVVEDVERGNEAHVDRPGYESRHLVVKLTRDTLIERGEPELGTDITIEIQVRSILQDALASFEHDLAYKVESTPSPLIRRRLVELASLLQVTDRLFTQVRQDALTEAETSGLITDEQPAVESGGWTDDALQGLIQSTVGEAEADPLPWLRELRQVLEQLGYASPRDVDDAATELGGGPALARRLRQDRPWLTGTQVLDLLLRSALGDAYFDRRSAGLEPHVRDAARFAFDHERAEATRYRTASS